MQDYRRFKAVKTDYKAKIGMIHLCEVVSKTELPKISERILINGTLRTVKSARITLNFIFPNHIQIEIITH